MNAIINVRIYDYQNYIENGYVVFDNRIIEVGCMNDFVNKGYSLIDGKGQLLLPNFVCSHSHIYSIFARGLSLPFNPQNFQDILEQMWWKIDREITNKITYYSGIAASSEFMKNGVTTIIDHHASGTDILGSLECLKTAIVDVCGLRSILCFETSDRFPIHDCLNENVMFFNKYQNKVCCGLFGLHASMSLADLTLKLVDVNSLTIPIHIHVAESKMDEEDSYSKYGKSIIQRLDEHHLLKNNSLIVHGVYLSQMELEKLEDKNIYIVVNTTSNMNNAVGLPDVSSFKKHNIKLLVGNDGLSTSMAIEYLNLFYTSHLKSESPKSMDLMDVIDIINNAYKYVSNILGINLGRIASDYEADFMLIPYIPFTQMDATNAFGHIFYGLYPCFVPNDVYCQGKLIVHDRDFVNPLIKEELIKAKEAANDLWLSVKGDN